MCAAVRTLDKILTRLQWSQVIWNVLSSEEEALVQLVMQVMLGPRAGTSIKRETVHAHKVSPQKKKSLSCVGTICDIRGAPALHADSQKKLVEFLYPVCVPLCIYFL